MKLELHNTLTRNESPFEPIDRKNVRMYVCGPTVYDFAHIGNARPLIVFDVLFRLLRNLYGADHVHYVRNITDVDDKINARAAEDYPDLPLNEAIKEVTRTTYKQFRQDVKDIGCLQPTSEPRATRHIPGMRSLITRLVESGHAYVAEDNVLFSVPSMLEYGQLSKQPLDEMVAGARVEIAPYKRDPLDFILWKPSKPGEPAWPSPAGIKRLGRPGWHLECSAMADKWLWTKVFPILSQNGRAHPHQFDIHGGGIDLVFPHHENEIAQSRCAFHTPMMANYWVHNGFLQVDGEKMSKSLGNFVTIRDLLSGGWKGKNWRPSEIRLAMLSTHYRQPIDWTFDALLESRRIISHWQRLTALARHRLRRAPSVELITALCGDLNTPRAITHLHALASEGSTDRNSADQLYADLVFLGIFADRKKEDRKLEHESLLKRLRGARRNASNRKGKAAPKRK
jgi:cysteinyl-tRNA synthetase